MPKATQTHSGTLCGVESAPPPVQGEGDHGGTCHGVVLLLQRCGVDDAPEEAPVADGVLLPLVALVQQLVVQQEQLAAQRVELVQWGGACQDWGRYGGGALITM